MAVGLVSLALLTEKKNPMWSKRGACYILVNYSYSVITMDSAQLINSVKSGHCFAF